VACSCQEQIRAQRESAKARSAAGKAEQHDHSREESGEDEGMCESPMSAKVAVSDTEAKSHNIKIRNDGTHHARHPNTFRHARPVEAGSKSERGHRM
jgi:hypothetical protein